MKILEKIIIVSILIYFFLNSWSFISEAFLFGNPEMNYGSSKDSFEIVYEQGHRKIHDINDEGFATYGEGIIDTTPPKSNERIRLDHSRLYLQWYEKWSDYYSIFYRILIGAFATDLSFEGTPYNPDFWGLGGGIQFNVPTKLNRLKFYVTTSWDWSYGWQENIHTYPSVKPFSTEKDYTTGLRNDEVNWTEATIALWSSYPINERFNIYGGISKLRTKIYVELGEYNHTRWFLDQKNGGFLGFKYLFNKNYGISCEFHGYNEYTGIITLFKNI